MYGSLSHDRGEYSITISNVCGNADVWSTYQESLTILYGSGQAFQRLRRLQAELKS
jgi:hypothetical protein